MSKGLSILLVACALFAGSIAFANGATKFSITVYAEGEVAGEASGISSVMVGSGDDVDLRLDELAEHALVVRRSSDNPDNFILVPLRDTEISDTTGESTRATRTIGAGELFWIGQYMFEISDIDEDSYEPAEYQHDEDEEEAQAVIEAVDVEGAASAAQLARTEEFSDDAYRFCHDDSYGDEGVIGADLCAILDESTTDSCPLGRQKCAEWLAAEANWIKSDRDPRVADAKRLRSERRMPMFNLQLPSWLLWGALILGIGILLAVVIKSVMDAGWETDEFELPDEDVLSAAARNLQALPEARAAVLLRLATKALNGGDPGEAAILLHLACLRHFDDSGAAQYHPSKTNGDYLRALRRNKTLRDLFRQVALHTERLRFGDGTVAAGSVQALIEDAKSKLSRSQSAPPPVALSLLLCAVAVSQSGCPSDSPWHPYYSHEPAGMAALPDLLEEAGLKVEISRERWIDVPPETSVVVLRTSAAGPSYWPPEVDLDALLDRGLSVVFIDDRSRAQRVFPVTATVAERSPPLVVNLDVHVDGHYCASDRLLPYANTTQVLLPAARRLAWTSRAKIEPVSRHELNAAPFLSYRGYPHEIESHPAVAAFAVQRRDEDRPLDGCLYLFADRDLFTNASLTRPDNLAFVTAFFADLSGTGKIMFMERLDRWAIDAEGQGEDKKNKSPVRALKASNMLPFLAQGFVTLALLFVFLGAAFGPLRDPIRRSHKNFVEHVEALGRQYARTGKPGLTHSATSLAHLVVLRYRDRLRGGAGGGWGGLAEELSEKKNLKLAHVKAALRLGLEGQHDLGPADTTEPEPASEDMLRTLNLLLRSSRKKNSTKRDRR